MNALYLEREGSSPWGTFGRLQVGDWECCTVEPRWRGNAVGQSCIPDGNYRMSLRESPMVARTTSGRFQRGWEVTDVPGRTFVMIHPGNWARNSDGCILVGRSHAIVGNEPGITSSQDTFSALMERLASADEWDLHVLWSSTDYP